MGGHFEGRGVWVWIAVLRRMGDRSRHLCRTLPRTSHRPTVPLPLHPGSLHTARRSPPAAHRPRQWFSTYNYLDETLPAPHTLLQKLLRQALIGFVASVLSDTVSNSLRVVKTYRQVNETRVGYVAAARAVVAADGIKGLLGRGLKTRILANGLQGVMFSVLWRLFMDLWVSLCFCFDASIFLPLFPLFLKILVWLGL